MTSPIQLEAFEQIKASSRMALLRLIFRPAESRGGQTRIAKLVVNNHTSTHRVAPLPALPAPGGAERVAFAVPYELLQGERVFSVELEDGDVVELPYPMPSGSTPVVPTGTPSAGPFKEVGAPMTPARTAAEGEQPEQRLVATEILDPEQAEIEELRRANLDGEERLMAEAEARAAAEIEAEALRAQVEQLKSEAEQHSREFEGRCDGLERRLTDALTELEAVTNAERRAVRETRRLRDKLAQQAAELKKMRTSPG
jgi:hypothetical protein